MHTAVDAGDLQLAADDAYLLPGVDPPDAASTRSSSSAALARGAARHGLSRGEGSTAPTLDA
eukprot:7318117-Alexandrium_andersonii.AAC.1